MMTTGGRRRSGFLVIVDFLKKFEGGGRQGWVVDLMTKCAEADGERR